MLPVRNIQGALHGSRIVEMPHVAPKVAALREFIAGAAPVLVEIGFDHGRRLSSTAEQNPGWKIVGIETRKRRVEQAETWARRRGFQNVLVWSMDARTVFAHVLPDASIDIVEVLFPTPWWNPAHRRKRLLITDEFLADVVRVLRPGGLVHIATDVDAYADDIDDCFAGANCLSPISLEQGAALRPPCAQMSRREWKCEREGIFVHRRYARLSDPGDP